MSEERKKYQTIKKRFEEALKQRGITTYISNPKDIVGKPDFAFPARKIAVFCDGDYLHGYKQVSAHNEKVKKTIEYDLQINKELSELGWIVFRFWEHDIKQNITKCVNILEKELRKIPRKPYRTIDLCAGIGGIRKGFELTGCFLNVVSAEIDKYACRTYKHLFGEDPFNDLTTDSFKETLSGIPYDILLAGFPCQTFSRVGKEEGFEDESKGQIFFHIAEIIRKNRPMACFLENVDHLVSHDNGETFRVILDTLVNKLGYYVIGAGKAEDGGLIYNPKAFIRNSRDFGIPQNRPRTYIICFDTERFSLNKLEQLPDDMPWGSKNKLYEDLNDLLDKDVDVKYYMSSGYLETLVKHRARQEEKGYGFGYRIVNAPSISHPVANTLLATGGSGKERNLIYDPRDDIAGKVIPGKQTPLNDKGIRIMTPSEWGKLQGFINYAFLDKNGNECFSFPQDMPDSQQYKQFGNAVTIPVIKEMAQFIIDSIDLLKK